MKTSLRRAYVFKMKLLPANIAAFAIFVILIAFSFFFGIEMFPHNMNAFLLFTILILYLMLHELLHGIGYILGGCKRENVVYGIALEKGMLYAMANQELSKNNILLASQMPFTLIGVITYTIGAIFNFPLLVLLSIVNITGAIMDMVMFFYILRLNKDTTYSESGQPDEFVLITSDDLIKKKSLFFLPIRVRKYKEADYVFEKQKRIRVSRFSIIFLIVFLGLGLLLSII